MVINRSKSDSSDQWFGSLNYKIKWCSGHYIHSSAPRLYNSSGKASKFRVCLVRGYLRIIVLEI